MRREHQYESGELTVIPSDLARMREKLTQQLGYLARSSKLFDLGYLDEAIRVATSLRVLFHDPRKEVKDQGSILKLLGHPPIQLVTTCSRFVPSPTTFAFDGYLQNTAARDHWITSSTNGGSAILRLPAGLHARRRVTADRSFSRGPRMSQIGRSATVEPDRERPDH
jgi:hypothetical protein